MSGSELRVVGGEIQIRGPVTMAGYLNAPEATAAMIDADGWLHTGDLGRVDDDGNVFVVDRIKELIKVNALQVAPAELEALLGTHPAVADAAVLGLRDREWGEAVSAFVVLSEGASVEELLRWCRERLAPYKVPKRIEQVPGLPRSASGKLLREEIVP
jgi:acyl-CoA synthetase (AMP-forming)/AMP-acid ligase II